MNDTWRERSLLVIGVVCLGLIIRAVEMQYVTAGLRSEMSEQWTRQDMSRWASRMRKNNPEIKVPYVTRGERNENP